jgi:transcriptional regulator with XRE-family HTH domain
MVHPVDEFVGKRLRERRTLMGLSQEGLAKTVGITFQQVQKYERGTNRMSASRLYEFAHVLDISVAFFFEGYRDASMLEGMQEASVAFEHEDKLGREVLELTKAYHRIPNQKTRRAVNDLIRSIADESALIDAE